MQGDVYRRPLLCRLCECPVVDRGVRLQKHNREKVSRWWKAHFDTDLGHEKSCIICYFCVWDLRFANQHSEEKEPADQIWWPKNETHRNAHHNNDKYYNDDWMKPCSVKIAPLGKLSHTEEEKAEHNKEEHQSTNESRKCFYCGKLFSNLKVHLIKEHKTQILWCPNFNCKEMFKTAKEKDQHFVDFHKTGKFLCCFCDIYFDRRSAQWKHMKIHHKEALKCNAKSRCSDYFKTEEDRKKHVLEKHSVKYKCIYCDLSYGKKRSFMSHVKGFHKDVALKCEYTQMCSTWFKTEEERQNHYKEDHESGNDRTMCPICKKMFLKSGIIRQHIWTNHKEEKILKCDYTFNCANYFSNEEDKLKHIKEFHEILDEKFRCLYCEKIIPKRMRFHINQWHKDVAIKCNFIEKCPTYFKTLEEREKHVREVHQVERIREPVQCFHCDKTLAGKLTLNTHINFKHPEIAIKCKFPMCDTYFKSQEDLETHFSLKPKHKKIVKKEPRVNRFECALCQKTFYYKSQVKYHIMSIHRRTKDKCPHCKKTTSKLSHILSAFCKKCNKKFLCLELLKSHAKICKPVFQCPVCSKSFIMEPKFNFHCKRNHTVSILKWKGLQFESRGFKCDECLIYFSSKNNLKRHNRLSHGLTVFTCDFCQQKFSNKVNAKNHISRHHLGLTKFVHCPVCNLKLADEYRLKAHTTAIHFNQDLITCEICAKMLKPSGLKVHLKRMH